MSIFENVKEAIPFERYCNDRGIFNGSKKDTCPFHDDHNPSLHNYGTHGYCFVCRKRADIIDLEASHKGLSPLDAALSLAKEYYVPLPEVSPKEKERFDRQLRAYELIERFTAHANKKIKKHPEVIEFLRAKGLDESDIDRHSIGYVGDNNPVATNLKDQTDIEIAEDVGLINKGNNGSYYDHFRNRIIIPILKHGKAVYLTGRASPDNTITENNPKYLHLRNSDLIRKQIYLSENLNKNDCCIVEGVFDAVALDKAGFNTCALLGTNLGEHARDELLKSKAKKYVAFDSDEAGNKASYPLAKEFRGYILNTGYKEDFDELLVKYGIDKFREIIEKGINEATYYLYAVIENEDIPEALKEISKLELASHKETWINKLSKKHEIGTRGLQSDLKAICNEVETTKEDQKPYDPLSEYTDDEIGKARELLGDPDLLNKIVEQIGRNGYIGEKVNKRVLVLSFTSRLFDEAISNVVKGKSSSGKSALVKAVLKVFPKSVYRAYTDVSSQALYRLPGLDLSHTILVIYESHGSEKADYPIRSSISEGELSKLVTEPNPKTGSFEAKEIFIPARGLTYVETTTKSQINPENQTRLFDLYIDESNEQSREILQSKAIPINNEMIDKENRPYQALQLLLRSYDVFVPYLGILADTFPVDKVRCRRDFTRFENLIKAHCLLHQEQREKSEVDGKTYLEATIEDYKTAYELATVVLSQTLKEITPQQEKILQKIKEQHPEDEISMSELAKLCNCKVNTTFRTEVYALADSGYLEHNGEKGIKSKYKFISIPQEILKLPTPEALKKLLLEKSDSLTNTTFLKKSASLQEVKAETLVKISQRLVMTHYLNITPLNH
ncbi:MAG: toprim domain-containing protein [Thermodesulfobacteriota bacterium]